ncbi:E3 ubiquitin-protein ligase RING1 [Apostasia shenzhenica]|uniref:RING-type E3 ubiquitin transferase n=1 Tax=Apostasia shenzhenica TaxID=1088818 RepID=A0A2I0AM75_9ASPA|nr:E3 ubiquitin-protein ligase RING1 [Apostasia shenzhenica]
MKRMQMDSWISFFSISIAFDFFSMAQVAELFAHLEEEEEEEETDDVEDDDDDDDDESLDLAPLCSPTFVANPFGSVFSTGRRISSSSSVDTILSEFFDEHPIFPHDRLDRVPPPPPLDLETLDSRDFRVLDVDDDYLSLDEGEDEEVGNEIFVTGRIDCDESSGCGLQIVDLGSDSDSLEEERVMSIEDSNCARDRDPVDLTLPLCWDFLRIEEERRDPSEDFEWEEVDDRLDDRGVLSMMVGIDDDETSSGSQLELEEARQLEEEEEEGFVESDRNVDWEVLLEISDSGITRSSPSAFMDHVEAISDFGDDSEDFVNPLYEEFPIGQVADHDSMTRACPPAAKMVVENLPSIMLTLEDLADNATLCAVCKDAFSVGEKAKQLPCSHWYHQDCILPWFGIRNTCPVCRYELPTDDPEYERSKARRQAGGAVNNEESLLRADFEVLSEG